jgi:hypothetical protein
MSKKRNFPSESELDTLRIVHALYKSGQEHVVVPMQSVPAAAR